ncbi:hypothetical protein [Dokdonella sp.]|uniref:hypothetical protein n=1 Tax=Dokdonella sp. TaxID=2291710 RepID=UPI001AFCD98C|nr:hypothetical protein [Dokdonella sp.]MBO9662533.1 hypothetical protein [Dokdonella sp.]
MKYPIVAAAILLLAGCASTSPVSKYSPVDPALDRLLYDRGVYLLVAPTPDFLRITGGHQATMTVGMLFGAVGGGIGAIAALEHARSAGRAIATENKIADPSPRLVDRVREMLAKYDTANTASGFAVTVAVDGWALHKDNVAFNASVVIAEATADAKKRPSIFAKGFCHYESAPNGPTAEALLADGAAQLKKELDTALEYCAEEFRTRFFL